MNTYIGNTLCSWNSPPAPQKTEQTWDRHMEGQIVEGILHGSC